MRNLRRLKSVIATLTILTAVACNIRPAGSQPARAAVQDSWNITQPRGAVREIDFHTDEGTWTSIDVSPDGQSLIFDLLAHIYKVPANGGEAVAITQDSGIATNYHPRFSPDGKQIAFVSDRQGQSNVWVMDPDGGGARIVLQDRVGRYAEPAWSPDGKTIYATRFEPNARGGWTKAAEIWRLPLDGSAPGKLVGAADIQVWTPAPSRDGRHLYYHQASAPIVAADGYYKISDEHHIRRIDLVSGRTEAITRAESRWYNRALPFYSGAPALSPDGQRLAFVREVPGAAFRYEAAVVDTQTGLWLRNLETGEESLLTHPLTPAQFQSHSMFHLKVAPGYAWWPDGASVVFPQGGKIRRLDLASGKVATIPFRAQVRRTISEQNRPLVRLGDEPFPILNPRWPALSPDGKELAFEAIGRIWLKQLPDGDPRPVYATDDAVVQMAPAWSPDGKQLAYATWKEGEAGHVWKVDIDGGLPQRLTARGAEYLNPAWAPDGTTIVALRGDGAMLRGLHIFQNGRFDLVAIPLDGGEMELIAQVRPQAYEAGQYPIPTFGSDGRIWLTQADEGGGSVLSSVALDGSPPRDEIRFASPSAEARLSPDGKWLTFQMAHNVFVGPADDAGSLIRQGDAKYARVSDAHGRYPRWDSLGDLHFFSLGRYASCAPPFATCTYDTLGLTARPDRAAGTVLLKNAQLLSGRRMDRLVRGDILMRDGRIRCVGSCEPASPDKVFDLTGKYLTPGIVSIHEHGTSGGADIFRPRLPELARMLSYGVTTVMEPAGETNVTLPEGELLRAGRMLGPRLLSTGPLLDSWSAERDEIRSYEDAARNVRRLAGLGAVALKQYFQIDRYQRQWLSQAARAHGNLMLTGEMMDLHYFIGAIMDGHTTLEHETPYWPYYEDVKQFLVESATPMSNTIVTPANGRFLMEYFMAGTTVSDDPRQRRFGHWSEVFRYRNPEAFPLSAYNALIYLQDLKDLHGRGLLVGLGGHGENAGLSTHWGLWSHALYAGAAAAWQSATIDGARYLGADADIGSIDIGKLADLLVLNSDPLADPRNSTDAAFVIKGGRIYDSLTLEQLWPAREEFGPRPWQYREDWEGVRSDNYYDRGR